MAHTNNSMNTIIRRIAFVYTMLPKKSVNTIIPLSEEKKLKILSDFRKFEVKNSFA